MTAPNKKRILKDAVSPAESVLPKNTTQHSTIPFYYKVREPQVRLYNSFPQNTILDKSLGTLAHFCSICHGNLSVRPPRPNSMLFIVMKLSLLVSNIVRGEGGSLFQ